MCWLPHIPQPLQGTVRQIELLSVASVLINDACVMKPPWKPQRTVLGELPGGEHIGVWGGWTAPHSFLHILGYVSLTFGCS